MTRNAENRSAYLSAVICAALAKAGAPINPVAVERAVIACQVAAAAAKRWSENCCNYPMTEAQQARGDLRIERLADKAQAALDEAGHPQFPGLFKVEIGGDPRGPCGQLIIAGERGDGFGPGYAIYR